MAVFWVGDVRAVVVKGRHAANQACEDRHGVCISAKTTQEKLHLFVDHGVASNQQVKVFLFLRIGQFAVE